VIPLAVTSTVRRRIAPDAAPSAANEAVLRDVAADEVQDELGPAATGRLAHLSGGVIAGLHVAVAPTSVASANLSGERSTATICAGASAASSWIAMCPSPPAPITTALEPGTSL
jgi:hypothetical protein